MGCVKLVAYETHGETMPPDLLGDGRTGEDAVKLPFDVVTLTRSFRRYRLVVVLLAMAAAETGIAVALTWATRTFTASTVLRYVPLGAASPAAPFSTLQTELAQVKLARNLAKTRERLALPTPIDRLGAAIQVEAGRENALMVIRATWDSGNAAADIANTLRDVFLAEWIAEQVSNLERIHSRVRAELRVIDAQAEALALRIEELRHQINDEEAGPAAKQANLGFRYQQLRQAIAEDQARRSNVATLSMRELDLERARKLRAQDLVPAAEYEKIEAAYKSQLALTVDTDRVRSLKAELEDVGGSLATTVGAPPTLSLLNTTLLRSTELDLQRVAVDQKARDIASAIAQIREAEARTTRADGGPRGSLPVPSGETDPPLQPMDLREMLNTVLSLYGGQGGMFELVSAAEPPVEPLKSSRRRVAGGTALAVFALGLFVIVLRELLRRTIRSAPELRLRLGLKVLGTLPHVRRHKSVVAGRPEALQIEACRLLADRLRTIAPRHGARVLLTSGAPGEGRRLAAGHVASAIGKRGEKVVLVDAQVREPRDEQGLEVLCPAPSGTPRPGIGDVLSGEPASALAMLVPTGLPGVWLLPRGRALDAPEALRSRAMGELLGDVSEIADLVIVQAAPAVPHVDAGLLARWCDEVVLVVRAERTPTATLKRSIARLRNAGARAGSAILVDVQKPFQDLE